jgi:hypothetical protein
MPLSRLQLISRLRPDCSDQTGRKRRNNVAPLLQAPDREKSKLVANFLELIKKQKYDKAAEELKGMVQLLGESDTGTVPEERVQALQLKPTKPFKKVRRLNAATGTLWSGNLLSAAIKRCKESTEYLKGRGTCYGQPDVELNRCEVLPFGAKRILSVRPGSAVDFCTVMNPRAAELAWTCAAVLTKLFLCSSRL